MYKCSFDEYLIKFSHCDSMTTKGVENVGSPSEVENHFGWARVLHPLNLQTSKSAWDYLINKSMYQRGDGIMGII